MKFGLGVPTGTEGMMYPVPFADPDRAVELAVAAERLGFDSVWGNDHVTTQQYVRAEFAQAPRFYEPHIYMAYVAAETTTLRLATAITVMSFRHPAVLAKMAATLDQFSGGRFILGLGIGAYREEAEALWPGADFHRGKQASEYIQALAALFGERTASYSGEFVSFSDVESFPKPRQSPLPMLSGGNAPGSRERAALYCHGWLPASLSPDEISHGLADIREIAERAGRTLPADFDVAPQVSVALGNDTRDAMTRFESTQLFKHLESLSHSTLKNQQGDWGSRNLVGNAEQILDRVREYAAAGVTTLSALLFACNSVQENLDLMEQFSETVIKSYKKEIGAA